VSFSPSGGTFVGTQAVQLSAVGGGTIHYTLDGTTPSARSPAYDAPIQLSGTTRIRATVADADGSLRAAAAVAGSGAFPSQSGFGLATWSSAATTPPAMSSM
jgi:hypothetical protein